MAKQRKIKLSDKRILVFEKRSNSVYLMKYRSKKLFIKGQEDPDHRYRYYSSKWRRFWALECQKAAKSAALKLDNPTVWNCEHEIILAIEEFDASNGGYLVYTNKQIIEIGISNSASCCESWGWLTSDDNPQDFIGTTLLNISVVDTQLNKRQVLPEVDAGDYMFINLETTLDTLQFVLYNSQNGYYGHEAYVKSQQLTERRGL